MKEADYKGIIKEAFELWYAHDKYTEAYQKFEEAVKVANCKEEIDFCREHQRLIEVNNEADLSDVLKDISRQKEF